MPSSEVDRIGIDPCNRACLERALGAVGGRAELRLVDGNDSKPLSADALPHERIVRGDGTSGAVAAASIVAKVVRDRLMTRMDERYPGYGFERNKGYWRPEHAAAVVELGPTPIHRLSFDADCFAEFRAPAT
jgi:ribonuclease HII